MKEEDIGRYEVNGQVYVYHKGLHEMEQKFIDQQAQQKGLAGMFGSIGKTAGQTVFDNKMIEARLKEIEGAAAEYIAQQHKMTLAREYDWIDRAIKIIGIDDFKPYAAKTSRRYGKGIRTVEDQVESESMDSLRHSMWNSKVNHLLAIERSKFHDRYEDEKEAIDAQFTEEQEAITAKMVAHKLTNGDDLDVRRYPSTDESAQMPFKHMGIMIPKGINKFGIIRKK